jgi:UDP-2-acetamido-3-amino-2,3-dideoxy-glucuronate N-acetyltransferase
MGKTIHPTAIIDEGVSIGADTKIWHFCHIMAGASIGQNCILGQNVFVGNYVFIGDNVKIQNNVSLYSGLTCEDDVFVGPSVVFTNIVNPRSEVNRKSEFKKTLVKKGATLGANSTILCGITVGKYAFIGAGAVVTKDIPDYALVVGNPSKLTGWMSQAGAKLSFNEKGVGICSLTREKYQLKNNTVSKIS